MIFKRVDAIECLLFTMDLVKNIYELRQKFMIIGLTGRTGSGCTTIANLLKEDFQNLFPPVPAVHHAGITNDERKYRIEYNFLKSVWNKKNFYFQVIKASDIIFYYVLKAGFDTFLQTLESIGNNCKMQQAEVHINLFKNVKEDLKGERKVFDEYTNLVKKIDAYLEAKHYDSLTEPQGEDWNTANNYLNFIQIKLPQYRADLLKKISHLLSVRMTALFQSWGNNIRRYGSVIPGEEAGEPSRLAETINKIVKLMRKMSKIDHNQSAFIIIDSLRNPYEVHYFRERYSAFYLMSINTSESNRKQNLANANFRKDEIEQFDEMEYPSKRKDIERSYYSQDVEKCVELSDIHITHTNQPIESNSDLKRQLIHFISLILHPGLVQPTHEERLMQIAYTAKLNSGCISRQVGAVITDKNYSVKAIGWNTVAKGQTPCALRCLCDLYHQDDLSAFSEFELSNKDFRSKVKEYYLKYDTDEIQKKLQGIPLAYCFKDYYTVVKGEKNQVHTRSLHAEENAFLQLAKYGSEGIEGGYLFTTASPCELCAKKAYQLGITKVYYIDIYPGISESHIFHAGDRNIEMIQFQGAIGRAYEALYTPFFPLKDEIEYLSGVKVKPLLKEGSEVKDEGVQKKEAIRQIEPDVQETAGKIV